MAEQDKEPLKNAQTVNDLECATGHMVETGKRALSLVLDEVRPGLFKPRVTICEDCIPGWYASLEQAMIELGKFKVI